MKPWWAVAFGVVGGLLGAGILYLASCPPRGEPVILLPPPSPAPIVVHVIGAVAHPGVYTLPTGCRVQDVVDAAGGLLAEADSLNLNLAAPLEDGVRIVITSRQPTQPPVQTAAGQAIDPPLAAQFLTPTSGIININTADQEALESLPGIGPVTAQKILDYRLAHGPFSDIEKIQDVPGIGPKTFERIKGLITVEN